MSGFCVKKIGLTQLKLEFCYSWFQVWAAQFENRAGFKFGPNRFMSLQVKLKKKSCYIFVDRGLIGPTTRFLFTLGSLIA